MADIGYIYVNPLQMVSSPYYKSLYYSPVRYTIQNPDDVIFYITEEKGTAKDSSGNSFETHGNVYYLLSKTNHSMTVKTLYAWIRGVSGGGTYQNSDMDSLLFNAQTFDITSNTNYNLGQTGTNGNIDGTDTFKVGSNDYVTVPIQGDIDSVYNGRTRTVSLTTTPSTTRFKIGVVDKANLGGFINTNKTSLSPGIFKASNFANRYSSRYYDAPETTWWSSFEEYRLFYYNNGMYPDSSGGWTSFERIGDEEVFDGFPLFLNIHTTHDLDKAKKYLDDGTIPDDDTYISSDDGEPPEDQRSDSGGDDDDMDGMTNTSHTDDQSIINTATTHFYPLNYVELSNFVNWFWSDMLSLIAGDLTTLGDIAVNAVTGAYNNISQYINSVKKLNIDWSKYFKVANNRNITLGRYQYDGQTVSEISFDSNEMYLSGEYRVPFKHSTATGNPTFGAFLDYDPYTTISLYIPFIGIVPLQTNMVMGRKIRLYSAVDIYAGTIHFNVYVSTPKGEWSLIGTYEGKCGVEIPLTLDDSIGNSTNILKNVASTTVGLCTTGLGAMANIGNSVFAQPLNQVSGVSTNTSYYNPNRAAIIIQTTPATIPDNFGSTTGYLYRKAAKLGDLSGLTTCINPRIGSFGGTVPTDSERKEIYSLLQSGVII